MATELTIDALHVKPGELEWNVLTAWFIQNEQKSLKDTPARENKLRRQAATSTSLRHKKEHKQSDPPRMYSVTYEGKDYEFKLADDLRLYRYNPQEKLSIQRSFGEEDPNTPQAQICWYAVKDIDKKRTKLSSGGFGSVWLVSGEIYLDPKAGITRIIDKSTAADTVLKTGRVAQDQSLDDLIKESEFNTQIFAHSGRPVIIQPSRHGIQGKAMIPIGLLPGSNLEKIMYLKQSKTPAAPDPAAAASVGAPARAPASGAATPVSHSGSSTGGTATPSEGYSGGMNTPSVGSGFATPASSVGRKTPLSDDNSKDTSTASPDSNLNLARPVRKRDKRSESFSGMGGRRNLASAASSPGSSAVSGSSTATPSPGYGGKMDSPSSPQGNSSVISPHSPPSIAGTTSQIPKADLEGALSWGTPITSPQRSPHTSAEKIIKKGSLPPAVTVTAASEGAVEIEKNPHILSPGWAEKSTQEIIRDLLLPLAHQLATMHERGLVHLDLKPGNVLWDEQNKTAVLCDFGLTEKQGTFLTRKSIFKYSAPERLKEDAVADGKMDVWTAGIVFLEMLGDNKSVTARHQLREENNRKNIPSEKTKAALAAMPVEISISLPPDLTNLLKKMLHSDSSQRPSMQEVFSSLQKCCDEKEVAKFREKEASIAYLFTPEHREVFLKLLSPAPALEAERSPRNRRTW